MVSFMIAGTQSASGKTTVTMALLAALKKRGKVVQPFKVGPDYIDPMFHFAASGRKSCNLDSFLMEKKTIKYLYQKHQKGAEISVIEGVMGLFDGRGDTGEGSSGEMAKILSLPVILVVNASGMSRSVGALLQGFQNFDPFVSIKGVIFSQVKSPMQYALLKEIVEKYTNIKPLGYLEKAEEIGLESRHLGLVCPSGVTFLEEKIKTLAEMAEKTIEIDHLLHLCTVKEEKQEPCPKPKRKKFSSLRIGVAYDDAFCFYYQDNLDLLEEMGAELIFFSPMEEKELPKDLDGAYFGGGYPEIFAEKLEENHSFRCSVKKEVEKGLPVYAECGGLLYMADSLQTKEGKTYSMAGVLSGFCTMEKKLQHFGYSTLQIKKDCILGEKGDSVRIHEFHYAKEHLENETVFSVCKKKVCWEGGYVYRNLLASFTHIHFYSQIKIAEYFLQTAARRKQC